MKVKPIQRPLPGERVVAVQPTIAIQVQAQWRRRLHLYTGRTLSDEALHVEQASRAGRLVTMGQALSPGVVSGLELDLERSSTGEATFLHVAPGIGVAASGEDVIVPHELRIPFAALMSDGLTEDAIPLATPADVRVLVLEPATIRQDRREISSDPCDIDEVEDAFADEQTVDACYLRVLAWSADWGALPDAQAGFRNELAYRIFANEAKLAPGKLQPWEHFGVPIGIVGTLTLADKPVEHFVDRHAVVRVGGRAKRRTPLVSDADGGAGTTFLWQARIQQLSEQVADFAAAGGEAVDSSAFKLPPAGIWPMPIALPVEGGARRVSASLPEQWRVASEPLPIEQLDRVIASSASLEPYDVRRPDEVLVIVPVPQSVYEPRLLVVEHVSEIFQKTIDAAVAERDHWRALRFSVRECHMQLVRKILGPTAVPKYEEFNSRYPDDQQVPPDADALADEQRVDPLRNPESEGGQFGVDAEGGIPTPGLGDLDVFSDVEDQQLDELGFAPFIEQMDAKLARADDTIDFSFLKSHANIYRLRQLMLGNTASSRLATSPVMATIAKGASAAAVTSEVNKFFLNVKGKKPPGTTPMGQRPSTPPVVPPPAPPRSGPIFTRASFFGATTLSSRLATSVRAGQAFAGVRTAALSSVAASGSTAFPALGVDGVKSKLKTAVGRSSILILPEAATRETVQQAPPIVGEGAYDFRTTSIAERIEEPPAREAKSYAVAARAEALEALKFLYDEHMNVDDIPVFGVPVLVGEQLIPQFHLPFLKFDEATKAFVETNDGGEGTTLNPTRGMVVRLPQVRFDSLLDESKKVLQIHRVLRDPPGNDADEGNLFSETATLTEHAIATLRAVEGRIAEYRSALARCKVVLAKLEEFRSAAELRLAVIGDKISEQRHKVATASALLADETARLDQINERRQQVLDKHVRFFAYVRPRLVEARVDAPSVNLDPAAFETPVPRCLATHNAVPAELEQMIQLLREAPVAWFVHVPTLLDRLDRVELLQGTLHVAKLRATAMRDIGAAPSTFVAQLPRGKLGLAIDSVTRAQQTVISNFRYQVATLDLARFAGMGWNETKAQATAVLSLGDLLESNHGRSFVAEQAARELNEIGRIAACFYMQASEVVPEIRLQWSERLSQYEEAVELRELSALPRWGEVPFVDRRQLQSLADWLYGRIDASQDEGLAWIHDLVRVCLLLASHAPVNAILAGSVPLDTPASPGRTVPVVIDPRRVRVGMKVMFYKAQRLVAHGIVEDLVGSQARTRIAETVTKDLLLTQGTRAHFVDAEGRTAPVFFRKLL